MDKKMRKIKRKSLLYKTDVEYGDFTINHIEGCAHGCNFPCYAMLMAKRFGRIKIYEEWCQPGIVVNALELLEKEIPRLKNKINFVHLSFMTDPFMYRYPEVTDLTLKVIEKLNENNIKVTVLTKGLLPAVLTNLKKFKSYNEYGISLVSLDENFKTKYEPFSSNYENRINSLRHLHENGLNTWISIEPYPTPNIIEQDIRNILEKISFVDKIIFGRMNYNSLVSRYKNFKGFYQRTVGVVSEFCVKNNIDLHIKKKTVGNNSNTRLIEFEHSRSIFRRIFP
jgi:DNA repair photolyase